LAWSSAATAFVCADNDGLADLASECAPGDILASDGSGFQCLSTPSPVSGTSTITLGWGLSAEEIQTKVSAAPRYIPAGATLIFDFDPGEYVLDRTLRWQGFYGGGNLIIQGTSDSPQVPQVPTSRLEILNFTGQAGDGIVSANNDVNVIIRNLAVWIQDDPSGYRGILIRSTDYAYVAGNYVRGGGMSHSYCVLADDASVADIHHNRLQDCKFAVSASRATVDATDNDSGGQTVSYGANAEAGGVLTLTSPVPDGPFRARKGGILRYPDGHRDAALSTALAVCWAVESPNDNNEGIDVEPMQPLGWPNDGRSSGDAACLRGVDEGRPVAGRGCRAVYAIYFREPGSFGEITRLACNETITPNPSETNKYFACCDR
jgi:hypothetical protein